MSRRSRRRTSTRRKVRRALQIHVPEESQAAARQEVDFQQEYRYVLADLKRIGLLAVVMIAVLIGLSLLLP